MTQSLLTNYARHTNNRYKKNQIISSMHSNNRYNGPQFNNTRIMFQSLQMRKKTRNTRHTINHTSLGMSNQSKQKQLKTMCESSDNDSAVDDEQLFRNLQIDNSLTIAQKFLSPNLHTNNSNTGKRAYANNNKFFLNVDSMSSSKSLYATN